MLTETRTITARRRRWPTLLMGAAMTASGWAVLWSVESPLNPLAFTALWTGAAVVMWSLSATGYPSVRRHLALAVVSIPVWWWFELVNVRVANWRYVSVSDYEPVTYALLSSIAFATVTPALAAATALLTSAMGGIEAEQDAVPRLSRGGAWREIAAGALCQIGVVLAPTVLYPLVWVAPFLVLDGAATLLGSGHLSLTARLLAMRWRLPVLVGLAGLLCGVLWEFWNYWAAPKWEYHIPYLGFAKVFEMPVLGYGGYVPFAWAMAQAVMLVDLLRGRMRRRDIG